jgi:hypothetical protein
MLMWFESVLICAAAGAYLTALLRFDPEAVQPTPPWSRRLLLTDEGVYVWSYFDYVRALLGAYQRAQPLEGRPGFTVYTPTERAYGFLSCAKCLSFWTALPFTLTCALLFQWHIGAAVTAHVAAAFLAWQLLTFRE